MESGPCQTLHTKVKRHSPCPQGAYSLVVRQTSTQAFTMQYGKCCDGDKTLKGYLTQSHRQGLVDSCGNLSGQVKCNLNTEG